MLFFKQLRRILHRGAHEFSPFCPNNFGLLQGKKCPVLKIQKRDAIFNRFCWMDYYGKLYFVFLHWTKSLADAGQEGKLNLHGL